jgi:hypothetical protein
MAALYWSDLSNEYKGMMMETVSSMLKLQLCRSKVWLIACARIKKEAICAKEGEVITGEVK